MPCPDPTPPAVPGPWLLEPVLERRPLDTLMTCPMQVPVTVSRVTDQDPDFLRFVERRELKPGDVVRVEDRDPAADSVRLRDHDWHWSGVESAGPGRLTQPPDAFRAAMCRLNACSVSALT